MPAPNDIPLAGESALRDQCTVFLAGHGPVTAAALLSSIPADTVPGRYGEGGAVAELEEEIAGLLGKPAAAFVPSGTMAQQSVLRVHADRRQRRTVIFHPMCHMDRHEGQAYQRLHGLTGRPAGDPDRLLTIDDLAEQRIWVRPKADTTADPSVQRVELSVGDATCALRPAQVRDIIAVLVATA